MAVRAYERVFDLFSSRTRVQQRARQRESAMSPLVLDARQDSSLNADEGMSLSLCFSKG